MHIDYRASILYYDQRSNQRNVTARRALPTSPQYRRSAIYRKRAWYGQQSIDTPLRPALRSAQRHPIKSSADIRVRVALACQPLGQPPLGEVAIRRRRCQLVARTASTTTHACLLTVGAFARLAPRSTANVRTKEEQAHEVPQAPHCDGLATLRGTGHRVADTSRTTGRPGGRRPAAPGTHGTHQPVATRPRPSVDAGHRGRSAVRRGRGPARR